MDDLIGIPFLRGLGGDADTVLPQENTDMDMMGAQRAQDMVTRPQITEPLALIQIFQVHSSSLPKI